MARKRPAREAKPAEPEEDEDEDGSGRDYVMARLASARNSLQATIDSIDEAVALFNNPDDDDDGKERSDLVDSAVETVGFASRALEAAEEAMDDYEPTEGEPWDEE